MRSISAKGPNYMAASKATLSKHVAECSPNGCFYRLSNNINTIESINRGCDYLISLLNRLIDRVKRTDVRLDDIHDDELSNLVSSIKNEITAFVGGSVDKEFDWAVGQLGFISSLKDAANDNVDSFVDKVVFRTVDCLKNDDFRTGKPEVYNAFYKMVIEKSPVCDYTCSVFDHSDGGPSVISNSNDKGGSTARVQPNAYLYKVLFHRNITSCLCGNVAIHPNIPPLSDDWIQKIRTGDILAMKISLINNGIRFEKNNDIKDGVNSSVDLMMDLSPFSVRSFVYNGQKYDKLPINCAFGNEIASLSPFSLRRLSGSTHSNKYDLYFYGEQLQIGNELGKGSPVVFDVSFSCIALEKDYYPSSKVRLGNTLNRALYSGKEMPNLSPKDFVLRTNGIPHSEIGFIATDRIRFQHNCGCEFVKKGIGCKFCEMTIPDRRFYSFGRKEIEDVIEKSFDNQLSYRENYDEIPHHPVMDKYFDHVLIGGGTILDKDLMEARIITMCEKILSKRPEVPIYLMSVPPSDHATLVKFHKAGVTEVSFNIEVFDQVRASKYMPGKSRTPLAEYISELRYATNVWKKPGSVRSALIIGLETEESTLEGVHVLTSIGVTPILSIFRPIRATKLGYVMPLLSDELYDLYARIIEICDDAGLEPGPSCIFCQNNVLALPKALLPKALLSKVD